MTRVEQLYERLQRQLGDATKLLDEYHALEDRGSDAAKEKRAEFVTAKEAAEQTRADMKDAEQMSALADIQLVRTEQSPGRSTSRPGAPSHAEARDLTPPSSDQMRERRTLLDRMMGRNTRLSDEENERAVEIFPVENGCTYGYCARPPAVARASTTIWPIAKSGMPGEPTSSAPSPMVW